MDQGTPVTIGPTVAPLAPCLTRLVALHSVEGAEAKRQGPKERLGHGDAAWMTRGLFRLIHREEVAGASIWPVEIKRQRNPGHRMLECFRNNDIVLKLARLLTLVSLDKTRHRGVINPGWWNLFAAFSPRE